MLHGTAATVVLLRDAPGGLQVLLLERPRQRGSFAGAWVFPGGVVDPADQEEPPPDDDGGGPRADSGLRAARRAGVRETAEETGLVLQPQDLVRLSRWVPPPEAPRRWKTEFFIAAAPAGCIRLSPGEHVDAAWLTPAEALHRSSAGTMDLVPPTWVTLHGLQEYSSAADALAGAAAAVPETYATRQLPGREPPVMVWQDDFEYPGRGPGAPHASRRHRLVRDGPSWRYQRTP